MTRSPRRLARIIEKEKPGYAIRPKTERHGRPETGDPHFRTLAELKARYAKKPTSKEK
jgi:hypothetical protein